MVYNATYTIPQVISMSAEIGFPLLINKILPSAVGIMLGVLAWAVKRMRE
jgi:hypothetical protein